MALSEQQALKQIFDHRNQAIADRIGKSYSYATYLRLMYNKNEMTEGSKANLLKAFGYGTFYKRID